MIIHKIALNSFITQGNISMDINADELNTVAYTAVNFGLWMMIRP
jgi:hypothetical protein